MYPVDHRVVSQRLAVAPGRGTLRTDTRGTTGHPARPFGGIPMKRLPALLFRGMVALLLLVPVSLVGTLPAAAATAAATTTCSNGVDNTGGLGLICEVTVVNTITASSGSATVKIRECHGAAGAPTASCLTRTTSLVKSVTAVTQCNNSINGGGGTLRCSVTVTNNFYGATPSAATAAPGATTAVTVNQCVGSGASGIVGATINCDPFPANTTGAAITQCNSSANGGTLVGLDCTATGTMNSTLVVTINQCNGSANGGGALVICSSGVVNHTIIGTPPPTGTSIVGDGQSDSAPLYPLLAGFALLGGLAMAVVVARRRSIYR